MRPEQYLELMHGSNAHKDGVAEFNKNVIETLPKARESLQKTELWQDPLGSIKVMVGMMDFLAGMKREMGFSNVCNIVVLTQEAEKRGFTEEQVLAALFRES